MINKKNRYIKFCLCLVLFCNCLLVSFILGPKEYLYDSRFYWTISDPVISGGSFNLMDFPETFRGCLLPLLNCFIKQVIPGHYGWILLSALMTSITFAFMLPSLLGVTVDDLKAAVKIVAAQWCFFYFWADFLQFPLSDLPAAFSLMLGIFMLNAFDKHKLRGIWRLLLGFTAGASFYFAYNTRAAYLYGVIFYGVYYCIKNRKIYKQIIVRFAVVVLGMLIISIPQCMLNKQYVGKFSPKIYTEQYTGYGSSLQARQVFWGLEYQRYETYVGDPGYFPHPAVHFSDMTGLELLYRENLNQENFKIKDFFVLFFKYPLDMIGIYTRHLVALITPAWKRIYIENMYTNKFFLVIISIFIWFIAGINFIMESQEKKLPTDKLFILFSVMLPSFLQLLGMPELRFFVAVYLVLYAYVFLKIDYRRWLGFVKKNWKTILPVSVIIIILWISVFGSELADNSDAQMIIHDYQIESFK